MIPKILKIKGLYSYREEQVIDFRKLTDAGLFGIFGDVGSGKSTILEAIIFCIYGKLERLKQSGENRYYNMMNLMMNESEIDFTFIAGVHQQEYNINYKFGRNKNNFEDVSVRSEKFYRVDNDIKIPVKQSEIQDAVGLTYENFKMTVIIPQGKFRDFIELSTSDRSKMLKELFRLHDFDLFDNVKKLDSDNNSQLDNKTGEISAYQFVDENKIIEKEQLLANLQQDLVSISADVVKFEKEVQEGNELRNNTLHLQAHQAKLVALKGEEDTIKQLEIELNEYINTRKEFRDLYMEELQINNNLEKENKNKKEILEKKSKILDAIRTLRSHFEESEKEFNTIESLRSKASEFEKLAELLDCKEEESNFNKQLSEIQKLIKSFDSEIANQVTDKTSIEERLKELKNKLLPANVITQVGKWFAEKENEEKIIQQIQGKIDVLHIKLENNQKHFHDSIIGIDGLDQCTSTQEADQLFLKRKSKFQRELNLLLEEKTSLTIKHELSRHASLLEDGKPCMLCGSIHHPIPLKLRDSSDAMDLLVDKIETVNQKLANDVDKEKEIYSILKNKEELEAFIQESISDIAEKKSALAINFSEIPFKEYAFKDVNDFISREKEYQQNLESIEKLEADLKLIVGKIDEFSKKRFEEQKKEVLWNTNLQNVLQRNKVLKESIPNLDISLYLNEHSDIQRTRKDELLKRIQTVTETFNNASKSLNSKESENSELDGSLNVVLDRIAEDEPKLAIARGKIKEKLDHLKLDYDEVYKILIKKLDESERKSKIDEFKQKLADINTEINLLNKKIAGRTYDPVKFNANDKKLKETKERQQQLLEQKGGLENEIENERKNLKKKHFLQAEIDALQIRKSDIGKLKSMFTGNGFVDFVSKRYLSNVVAIANKRFRKMVRQKYSLELKDGEIIIRDHMNEGKERSIKSLSGGQSFQAALSLALSLSENIQRNAGVDQHFFFLDEGFGSLDEDNLQIVFETLRGLQQENRIVGLISHVKTLQQELDIHLLIHNDEQHGSRINSSWKN